jgi:hypothetical protein
MRFVALSRVLFAGGAGFLAAAALAGCGPGGGPIGKVNGKVVANGQPVTGGSFTFAPINSSPDNPALPANGQVKSDGTFVLSTHKEGDGAAVGKHRVSYSWPARKGRENWDETAPGAGPPPPETISPFEGLVVKDPPEVEIKAGTNDITIELVPGPPVGRPQQE